MPFKRIKVIIKYNLCVICDRLMGFFGSVSLCVRMFISYVIAFGVCEYLSLTEPCELVRLHCIVLLHSHNKWTGNAYSSNENVKLTIHHRGEQRSGLPSREISTENFASIGYEVLQRERIIFLTANRKFLVLPAQRLIHNWRCCASSSYRLRSGVEALESVFTGIVDCGAQTHTHTRVYRQPKREKPTTDNTDKHVLALALQCFNTIQLSHTQTHTHSHTYTWTLTRTQIWKIQQMYHVVHSESNLLLNTGCFFRFLGCVCIDASQMCSSFTVAFFPWLICVAA